MIWPPVVGRLGKLRCAPCSGLNAKWLQTNKQTLCHLWAIISYQLRATIYHSPRAYYTWSTPSRCNGGFFYRYLPAAIQSSLQSTNQIYSIISHHLLPSCAHSIQARLAQWSATSIVQSTAICSWLATVSHSELASLDHQLVASTILPSIVTTHHHSCTSCKPIPSSIWSPLVLFVQYTASSSYQGSPNHYQPALLNQWLSAPTQFHFHHH